MDDFALALLKLENLLLHRVARDELVAGDDARLPDAVRAVGGLIFDGGIPPRVEVNHGVRAGEVHFDPWWNPAVEDQATDRAHRIGQTRVVTSYKLITRDTVEEKILQLQQRKREVIHAMLGGEEQLTGALSWDEIQDLLG